MNPIMKEWISGCARLPGIRQKGSDMKKRYQGALTLEAAIVLPIYIFAVLTLSYMIQSYYVHDVIDAAATAALQDMANKFFYLDQLGVIEAADKIAERTKITSEKLEATIEKGNQAVDDVTSDKDDIMSFSVGDAGKSFINAWKKGNVLSIIKGLLSFKSELTGQFKGTFGKLKDSKQDITDIFSNGKDLLGDSNGLGLKLVSAGVSKGLQYILSRYMLGQVRSRMGVNADRYRIHSISLDMGDNGILYTDKGTGLDRLLTVNIKYTIGIPLFVAPEVKMEKTVRKTIRAWIGD